MKVKKGCGYWDITKYPYGGYFKRSQENLNCTIIEDRQGQHEHEKVVKFEDNTIGVVNEKYFI